MYTEKWKSRIGMSPGIINHRPACWGMTGLTPRSQTTLVNICVTTSAFVADITEILDIVAVSTLHIIVPAFQ
jgi:hypothetical protein